MKRQAMWLSMLAVLIVAPAAWSQTPAWRSKAEVAGLAKQIDDYIAATQKEAGVTAVGPADPGTFFRRLHIDLAGMIPEYTESRGYVEDDDPNKLWERTGRFLTDYTFGTNVRNPNKGPEKTYARHFAAVLRSHMLNSVNQQAQPFLPTFELWLKDQLERDTGYDQIVRGILAPGSEQNGNMMAVRGGMPQNSSGSPVAFYLAAESKPENLAGMASRVFLGVKLECAQCHTHPFAKWTKDDFWQFAAFFSGTQQAFNRFNPDGLAPVAVAASTKRDIQIPGTNKTVKAKFLDGPEPQWKDNVATRTVLSDWITDAKNPFFAKAAVDMVWQYFFGISLLEPILEPSDDSPITHPKLLDILAEKFVQHNYDLKYLIRSIVHTQAYQRASDNQGTVSRDDYVLFTRMPVRGMSPEQLFDSVVEAVLGPEGHDESRYQVMNNFQRPPAGSRTEFISKFVNQDKRHESQTSILQALYLMNNRFLADRIKQNDNLNRIAAQQVKMSDRVRTMYLMVLSREPRQDETDRFVSYLQAEGFDLRLRLGDILWALVNSAEFRLNH